MKRLLNSEADPNIADYQFTLLQIAVASRDLDTVTILLDSGAYPNDTGNFNGIVWEEKAFMSRFNHLHSISPLYIRRHLGCVRDDNLSLREKNVQLIEAVLLEYGAVEIGPQPDPINET